MEKAIESTLNQVKITFNYCENDQIEFIADELNEIAEIRKMIYGEVEPIQGLYSSN